jgi:2-dehydropantoate 2-reductase
MMRILVLGAGAIGGYLGGRLVQGGADVTFLVRPRRLAQLQADGLRIVSPAGDATLQVNAVTAEGLRPQHDLILLTCKAWDLDDAIAAVEPGLAPGGAILPMLNGMSHLDVLDARFGRDAVLGGSVRVGAELTADGVVRHMAMACEVTFGERNGPNAERIAAIAAAFAAAPGLRGRAVTDVAADMWEKLVFLGTLASYGCLMRATVGEAVGGSPEGGAILRTMFEQAVEIARRHGHAPDAAFVARGLAMAEDPTSRMTASMLRDLEAGNRVEADHITGYLVRRARACGVDDKLFGVAYANLKAYERRREAGRLPQGKAAA